MRVGPTIMALAALFAACHEREPEPRLVSPADPPLEDLVDGGRRALAAAGIKTLRWGVTPYLDPAVYEGKWRALANDVAAALGVEATVTSGESYGATERALAAGQLDVVALSPFSYVRAKRLAAGLEILATHVAEGSSTYGAYLIAPEEGPVESLEDLRGKRVGFVDRASASGWLFPAARLLELGIDPEKDLEAVFLGTHDKVYDAVSRGDVAAGAVYSYEMRDGRKRHDGGKALRVIAKTARLPHDAYVVREGFPPEAARAIAALLHDVSTKTQRGRALLGGLPGINGFIRIDDSYYDGIRRASTFVAEHAGTAP